jgi:hypothetical protein
LVVITNAPVPVNDAEKVAGDSMSPVKSKDSTAAVPVQILSPLTKVEKVKVTSVLELTEENKSSTFTPAAADSITAVSYTHLTLPTID